MKLPLHEPEHQPLVTELSRWDGYVSSTLLAVEAIRACARYGADYAHDARSWLDGVALLPLDDSILDHAASLEPQALRSLDALHIATALSIREEIGVLLTYDDRMIAAATKYGIAVASPDQ